MGPIFCIYFFLCCINEAMYLDKNNTNSHVSHSISRCYLFHIPCQNSLLHILQLPLHQRLHTLLLFLLSRQSLSLRRSKNRGSIFFQKIASNANLFLAAYTTQKSPVSSSAPYARQPLIVAQLSTPEVGLPARRAGSLRSLEAWILLLGNIYIDSM